MTSRASATRRKTASFQEPDHLALKGPPSATVQAAWAICRFANGSCECGSRNHTACESVQPVARAVIEAAKGELAETYVLRKRPRKVGGSDQRSADAGISPSVSDDAMRERP